MDNVINLKSNRDVKKNNHISFPKFKWGKDWKYFQVNRFWNTRFKIWIYISKRKEEKLHFCVILGKLISLDTAHLGKKIFGRLNLTGLFGKDLHVYSSNEGVYSSK